MRSLFALFSISSANERLYPETLGGTCLAFICCAIACTISVFSIYQHLLNFNIPCLQRSVVRIMILAPLYSVCSFLSLPIGLLSSGAELALVVFRDVWEAVVIYCFLTYVLDLCGGENACAHAIQFDPGAIEHIPPVSWCIPKNGCRIPVIGVDFYHRRLKVQGKFFFRVIPCSPTFVKYCKRGTLQFVVLKPIMAFLLILVYVAGQSDSWTYWLFEALVYNLSYSIALYVLALFYLATKRHPALKKVKPLRKFMAVKLVVFATYWQTILVWVVVKLNNYGVRKMQEHGEVGQGMTDENVLLSLKTRIITDSQIRLINNFILSLEMPVFAFLVHWAFPSSEFLPDNLSSPQGNVAGGTAVEIFALESMEESKAEHDDVTLCEDSNMTEDAVSDGCASVVSRRRHAASDPLDEAEAVRSYSMSAASDPITHVGVDEGKTEHLENDADATSQEPRKRWGRDKANTLLSAAYRGKDLILDTISAPMRLHDNVRQQVDDITNEEKRRKGLENLRNVLGFSDIAEDARYNFDRRYALHSLLPTETTPSDKDSDFTDIGRIFGVENPVPAAPVPPFQLNDNTTQESPSLSPTVDFTLMYPNRLDSTPTPSQMSSPSCVTPRHVEPGVMKGSYREIHRDGEVPPGYSPPPPPRPPPQRSPSAVPPPPPRLRPPKVPPPPPPAHVATTPQS